MLEEMHYSPDKQTRTVLRKGQKLTSASNEKQRNSLNSV